jgi:hypothetical protein
MGQSAEVGALMHDTLLPYQAEMTKVTGTSPVGCATSQGITRNVRKMMRKWKRSGMATTMVRVTMARLGWNS